MKIHIPRLRPVKLPKSKKSRVAKKTRSHKKTKSIFDKRKMSVKEREGYDLGQSATALWNLQKNPGKVHVGGNRIHHGLVGAILSVYGSLENDDYVKGLGKSLMKDDIDDLPNWLNFENNNGYA